MIERVLTTAGEELSDEYYNLAEELTASNESKDILAALLSFAILINQPILVVIGAPILITLMFVGFFYMGAKYSYLLGDVSATPA